VLQVRAHERDPPLISRRVEAKPAVRASWAEQPVPAFPRSQSSALTPVRRLQLADPELSGSRLPWKHSTDIGQTVDRTGSTCTVLTDAVQKGARHEEARHPRSRPPRRRRDSTGASSAVADFDLVAALVGLDFGETNAASRVDLRPRRVSPPSYQVAPAGRHSAPLEPQSHKSQPHSRREIHDDKARRSNPRRLRPRDRRVRRRRDERGSVRPSGGRLRRTSSRPQSPPASSRRSSCSPSARGLAGALTGTTKLTVFAPTDAAFSKVPKATLNKLLRNRAQLRRVAALPRRRGAT
jgi:hypothetical protein